MGWWGSGWKIGEGDWVSGRVVGWVGQVAGWMGKVVGLVGTVVGWVGKVVGCMGNVVGWVGTVVGRAEMRGRVGKMGGWMGGEVVGWLVWKVGKLVCVYGGGVPPHTFFIPRLCYGGSPPITYASLPVKNRMLWGVPPHTQSHERDHLASVAMVI